MKENYLKHQIHGRKPLKTQQNVRSNQKQIWAIFLWIFEISQEKIRGGDGEHQVGIRGNLRAADTI
jgi:hypothetical protein